MVRHSDPYHQNYPLHLQGPFLGQHRDTGFVVADPMTSVFLNATHHSGRNHRFNKEPPTPTFIPEPRIRVAQMPELPEFFSQSRRLCSEAFGNNSNNTYKGHLLKPVKSQFPPPSPLVLPPSDLLEKTTGERSMNRYSPNENGIMSENVQQRYLFSKRPNYGPLSIPVTTTYHPATNSIRDGNLFNREESQNYNYKFRSFGRRSSDAREPMPKLGQGDARLGDGILFGVRKLNSSLTLDKVPGYRPKISCNAQTSPPSLTYSSYSPKSPAKTYHPQIEVSRFGSRNYCASPQRAPAPVPIGPVQVKAKKKIAGRPSTLASIDNDSKHCFSVTQEHQVRIKSTNTQPGGVCSKVVTEPAKKMPTGPKSMAPNYHHQLDATAPVFQPTLQTRIRARPARWKTQCRWTYNNVGDCRYGSTCHWGHEGDEYLDEPGVKHSFVKDSYFGGKLESNAMYDQSRNQSGPIDYSAHSSSSGYEVQSDDGVHKGIDGHLPDFSWVGGATNVNNWIGSQSRSPVYGTQTHQTPNTYESVQGLSGASNGPQKEIRNSEERQEYMEKWLKEGNYSAAVMADRQNDGQLQHLPAVDAEPIDGRKNRKSLSISD